MRRMRLHDHRATSSECGCRVAARYRKRQRKITGAEHCNRADGNLLQTQVGPRQRLAFGLRRIERGGKPAAFAHERREQFQLPDRAGALAFEACFRQRGFGLRAFDQRIAESRDVVRNRFQELRTRFKRCEPVGIECLLGKIGRASNFLRSAATESRLQVDAARRIEGMQRSVFPAHRRGTDQHFSGDLHVNSPERSTHRGPRWAPWVTKKTGSGEVPSDGACCRGPSRCTESFSAVRVIPSLDPPLSKQTAGPDIAHRTFPACS
ncbi:hypothetical protein AWB69_07240 [Caballeronia udeis]|uniref:Uncharacterized protein n=1 Tax=Caballeronia udeis TaxID=1232866 RepID=A0A158J684_9BURK|nr:hypothetical protein AWB69_07240 [Caballeronia udeis]